MGRGGPVITLILSVFLENGIVCMDELNARRTAVAITHNADFSTEYCGVVTGTVTVVRELPRLYVFPSGLGLRVIEGKYLNRTVYFFRVEYSI